MMGRGLGHASHRAAGGGGEGLAVHELELRGLSISDNRSLARSKSPVVSRACWDPWTPTLGGVSVQAEDTLVTLHAGEQETRASTTPQGKQPRGRGHTYRSISSLPPFSSLFNSVNLSGCLGCEDHLGN